MTPQTRMLLCAAGASLSVALLAQQPTPANLPEPFATPSSTNQPTIVTKPANAALKVPAGFSIAAAAENLTQPRLMVYAPNGDLFVAQSRAGSIVIMRGGNVEAPPDRRLVYASGLQNPFGMAFHDGFFYVGQTTRLVRYKYAPGDTKPGSAAEKLIDLPDVGHSTRNVLFNAAGTKMYVSVGSLSNKSSGEPAVRAAINEYNPDGSGHRVFASGLRNPVGLAWQPGTNVLWTAVNERDTLGDDLVPDYMTSVKDGGFYGWPYSYIGSHPDPEHKGEHPELVGRATVPDVLIPSHSAPLGLAFYTGAQFPERYRNGAFVALHGSWNRSAPHGYRIAFVPFANGKPAGPPEDFVTGWVASESAGPIQAWGRPVGITVAPDGSLLISDDGGGRIWRVRYGR